MDELEQPAEPVRPSRGNPLKRFAWKWAEQLMLAIGVLLFGAIVTAVQAVYTLPGRVQATERRTAELTAVMDTLRTELGSVSVATWTFVGLRCLEMSDTAMVDSKLPCGKAFQISGITRRLSR